MADDPAPPRKVYTLKPKVFDRVNPPSPGETAPAAPTGPDTSVTRPSETSATPPPDVRELARLASARSPLLSANAPGNRANDVHALLAGNHACAEAAGLNAVALPSGRRSRRRRDFRLLLAGGNAFIFAVFAAPTVVAFQVQLLASRQTFELSALLRHIAAAPALYAIPALGSVAFSAALAWLMFHVIEDY